MKISALRFFFCAIVAIALSLNSSAQTQAGQIKAARVENQVLKQLADGSNVPVKNGDMLNEKDIILTGKGASIVLVFSNGSSVKLGADTRLAIDEFKMDPLGEDINMSTLTAEPSKSKTTLNLAYGEMVGDVKKLNASSSYSIKTPVGAAGIRGTIFRIVFHPAADGKAFFTVSTAEGKVVMQGVTTQDIPIAAGKEVVVTVDIPTDKNTAAAPPVIVTHDIPPATAAIIVTASEHIAETVQQTIFNPVPVTNATPPPPLVPPPTQLTPGAGG
jgi:hypothetical protein